ncbi:MAG: glutaredoxin family protein [Capsulimonadaceae bacterium]|nr:glutaredoxin family protein [Capsulimonadaceae bacterium]
MNAPEHRSGHLARVVLYGKPECCLCEEALEVIERVATRIPFDFTEIDIRSDPAVYAQMIESIPVVEIDDVRFSEFRVDETLFENKLKENTTNANPSQGNPPNPKAR